MRSMPTFGVFFEVLLMVSYFFFKCGFFKCDFFFKGDFSGVNFTARKLPIFPRKNGH